MTTQYKSDPEYRPESYWDDPEAVFANIKGRLRRELLAEAADEGNVDDVPPEAFADSLSDESREAVAGIHPQCMGGEFLPDYLPEEVEIARVCSDSVTGDVISVRARPTVDGKITYRVVDEYTERKDWIYRYPKLVSDKPLTNAELIAFVDATRYPEDPCASTSSGLLLAMWESLSGDGATEPETIEGFLWLESIFYPGVEDWYWEREEEFLEKYIRPRIRELVEEEEEERREEEEGPPRWPRRRC